MRSAELMLQTLYLFKAWDWVDCNFVDGGGAMDGVYCLDQSLDDNFKRGYVRICAETFKFHRKLSRTQKFCDRISTLFNFIDKQKS